MKNYLTESEAITDLRKRGFNLDFNRTFSGPNFRNLKIPQFLPANRFTIAEVHRFEGDSNPDDECIIYAIISNDGYKGILVNGYGVSADTLAGDFIKHLVISY